MAWFKRDKQGILTSTEEKLEVPDGVWWQCTGCKKPFRPATLLIINMYVRVVIITHG